MNETERERGRGGGGGAGRQRQRKTDINPETDTGRQTETYVNIFGRRVGQERGDHSILVSDVTLRVQRVKDDVTAGVHQLDAVGIVQVRVGQQHVVWG